jgi:kynureninase
VTKDQALKKWGGRLIRAWNEEWMEMSARIGGKIAELIGADAQEVIIADSTSVNLFKLAVAALQEKPERKKIVSDDLNFPSDIYILESVTSTLDQGHHITLARPSEGIVSETSLTKILDKNTALVALSSTAFKSGFTYDLKRVTTLAHKRGAFMLWDLSHSVGVLPINLRATKVDLAVGCTYKYLNGGPGAPAFLYVRKDLQKRLSNPISGWFGHKNQFGFNQKFVPADSIKKFLTGTPPVLSIAGIECGVDITLEAGIENIRAKSVTQTEYLIDLFEQFLRPLTVGLASPREAEMRGSHVSFTHSEAYRIGQALIHEMGVIPDFRDPDVIRFGVAPLYTSYEEIFRGVVAMREVIEGKMYEKYSDARVSVT